MKQRNRQCWWCSKNLSAVSHAVVQRNGAPIAARIQLSRESGGKESNHGT